MPIKTESNITLHLPDGLWFRLHDWPGYHSRSGGLSHYHFKEMDFGWYEAAEDTVFLAELKDFARETGDLRTKVRELVKKAVDSLTMLHSCWSGMSGGADLANHLPQEMRLRKSIKIFMILRAHPDWNDDLGILNELFQKEFKAYHILWDLRYSGIISHGVAKKMFPSWVA